MNTRRHNRGFVGYVVLVVCILVIAGATQITLPTIQESSEANKKIADAEEIVQDTWHSYLEQPFLYIWNNLLSNVMWNVFIDNMKRIRNGEPTDFQKWAPTFGDPETHPVYGKPAVNIHIQTNAHITQ